MFQSLTIKNFRCFRSLTIGPLERINLIAGMNNTGKTALLEAIHLHCNSGNIHLPIEVNQASRSIQQPLSRAEDVGRWLFYDRNTVDGIEITSKDRMGFEQSLTMLLVDSRHARERYPEAENLLGGFRQPLAHPLAPRLILRYQGPGEETRWSISVLGNETIGVSARTMGEVPSLFLSTSGAANRQDNKLFSHLESSNRQGEILLALCNIEPRLRKLALLDFGNEVLIHGDVGLSRLVPIPFLGEGLRRALSIILAIANVPGGVVLIDEIENGLHYSVMGDVWKAIADAARRENVQVFATTHSWECLRAAHEAFSEQGTYDFRLHRLDRIDGQIKVVSYHQEMLETSLVMGLEVR